MDDTAEPLSPPVEDKAAEAREARRRRILQNSNKRLEKITGRPHAHEEQVTPAQLGIFESDGIIYPDPDTDPLPRNPMFHAAATNDPFGGAANGEFPMMNDENMAHIMELLSNLGGAGGGMGQQQAQSETPDNWIVKLIKTRVPIILLAVTTFFFFYTNQSHLFSGNVFISLLLWEAVELFLLKFFNKLGYKQSKITLILAFFGIRPYLVDRCLTMLGMLHKIIQDVSVFMFVFVFLHYALPNDQTQPAGGYLI